MKTHVVRYLTDPSGNNHTTNNLAEFCTKHMLCYEAMSHMCRGSTKQYKGWRNGHDLGVYKKEGYKVSHDVHNQIKHLVHDVNLDEKLVAKRMGLTVATVRKYANIL